MTNLPISYAGLYDLGAVYEVRVYRRRPWYDFYEWHTIDYYATRREAEFRRDHIKLVEKNQSQVKVFVAAVVEEEK